MTTITHYFYDETTFEFESKAELDDGIVFSDTNFTLDDPGAYDVDTHTATFTGGVGPWDIAVRIDPFSEKKEEAYRQIDKQSERTRQKYITAGAGQAMIYQEKGDEAADYITAGYPVSLVGYPLIQAEVNATGKTATDAADDIISMRTAWIVVGAQIEEIRLTGKKAVTDAVDQTGIDLATDTAIAALEVL